MGKKKEIKFAKLSKVKVTNKKVKKSLINKNCKRECRDELTYYVPRANIIKSILKIYPTLEEFSKKPDKSISEMDEWRYSKLNVTAVRKLEGRLYVDKIGISMDYKIVFKLPKNIYKAVGGFNINNNQLILNDKRCTVKRKLFNMIYTAIIDTPEDEDKSYTFDDAFPSICCEMLKHSSDEDNAKHVSLFDIASEIYFVDEDGRKVKDIIVL